MVDRAARRAIAREVRQARATGLGPMKMAVLIPMLVLVFVSIAVTWARGTSIDVVTRAEGQVVPSLQTQIIQSLEGGILTDLLVSAGDLVDAGQPLGLLGNKDFQADLGQLRQRHHHLLTLIARLEAEMGDGAPLFPEDLVAEAPQLVAEQTALMRIRAEALESRIAILEQQMVQKRQEILEQRGKIDQARASLDLVNQEMRITRPLVSSGLEARTNLIRLQRDASDLEGEISAAELAIPRLETALQEASETIAQAYTEFRADVRAELAAARADMASIQQRLTGARDRVERTEIVSPVRGVIKSIETTTIGGIVRPGDEIMSIVPLDDTLLIEARIDPADVGFLRPGLEAKISFSAYDSSIFGSLSGDLVSISADSLRDDRDASTYYLATFETETAHLLYQGRQLVLIPGMVATVDIMTGKRSILDTLLDPIIQIQSRALTER
jgi:adhesin transport system membrane fusion protein